MNPPSPPGQEPQKNTPAAVMTVIAVIALAGISVGVGYTVGHTAGKNEAAAAQVLIDSKRRQAERADTTIRAVVTQDNAKDILTAMEKKAAATVEARRLGVAEARYNLELVELQVQSHKAQLQADMDIAAATKDRDIFTLRAHHEVKMQQVASEREIEIYRAETRKVVGEVCEP